MSWLTKDVSAHFGTALIVGIGAVSSIALGIFGQLEWKDVLMLLMFLPIFGVLIYLGFTEGSVKPSEQRVRLIIGLIISSSLLVYITTLSLYAFFIEHRAIPSQYIIPFIMALLYLANTVYTFIKRLK